MRISTLSFSRHSRAVAVGSAILLGVLTACGGSTDTAATEPAAPQAAPVGARSAGNGVVVEQLAPAAFADRIRVSTGTLLNVHTPDEGEIPGTDEHLAYDTIVGDKRLPADKNAEILIYCRSGNMSELAGRSLTEAGYTRVVELAGGFNAWRAENRPFTLAKG